MFGAMVVEFTAVDTETAFELAATHEGPLA
jgi:hypothetical protein